MNGDRLLKILPLIIHHPVQVQRQNISSVRNTIALMSQSTYMKMSNKKKLCL
ncbi:hypothetical protein [Cylindrospermopsis raciborskii]|uniref:hypothetical protein n=1 Tax=Cylindrospermopsis raciborskii TaxID=77022 RepID=UPI001365EA66|nr:hypothetical protein [Cylindrospermopsis raciborskii]